MLPVKTFALKTFTLASVGLLALTHIASAEPRNLGETAMPTPTYAATANEVTVHKVQFLSGGTKVVGVLYLPATIA